MRGEKRKLPRDENGQIIIEHIDTKLTKKNVHTKISKVMLFVNGREIDFKFIEWKSSEADFIVSIQQLKKLKKYYNYTQVIEYISHIVFFINNKKYVYQSGKRDISLGIFKQDNKISLTIINNNPATIMVDGKIILSQDDFGLLIPSKENIEGAFGLCEGAVLIEP